MKKILVTGSTGFIGRNILPILERQNDYEICAPTRTQLNLLDENALVRYLEDNHFDVVLQLANPNPIKNSLDLKDRMFEDSLKLFMNFYRHFELYGKMIYLGSGAEYDKSIDVSKVVEKDCFRSIPKDSYGFAKYIMNQLCEKSHNIYNFRIFGCYGPTDADNKFITHCIRALILNVPITIRKDCKFDYLHVSDLAQYLLWGIEHDMEYHSYNVASNEEVLLSHIAQLVINKMNSEQTIHLLSEEINYDYTADATRIIKESGIKPAITLEEGVEMQIRWELENWSEETVFDGE